MMKMFIPYMLCNVHCNGRMRDEIHEGRHCHKCRYKPTAIVKPTITVEPTITMNSIDVLLLQTPSGNTNSDLQTARYLLVSSLSDNLESDIQNINFLLNGEKNGSNTEARIISIDTTLLISPSGVITADIAYIQSLLVTSFITLEKPISSLDRNFGEGNKFTFYEGIPFNTLETDIRILNYKLNGVATGSTIEARIGNLGYASSIVSMIGIINPSSIAMALGNT